MKATLTPTGRVVLWQGHPCRIWEGQTEDGYAIRLWVAAARAFPVSSLEKLDVELELDATPGLFIDERTAECQQTPTPFSDESRA